MSTGRKRTRAPEHIEAYLGRPIVIHKITSLVVKDLKAAAFLSQAMFWTELLPKDRDGWFYKTQDEWEQETTLSRWEQETARKKLVKLKFLEEEQLGQQDTNAHHRAMWFKVNLDNFHAAVEKYKNSLTLPPQTTPPTNGHHPIRNPESALYAETPHIKSEVLERRLYEEKPHIVNVEIPHIKCGNPTYKTSENSLVVSDSKEDAGISNFTIDYHRVHDIDLSSSLRSEEAQASLIAPLAASADSSFQEDETASDNGLIISNSPQTETEDLEARWIAECQGRRAVAGTRDTGIFNLLIRPMSASEFSEGYSDSEIGASATLEEPPQVAGAPPTLKTQPRRRQRAKRATPETPRGRNSEAVSAVGQKPPKSSHTRLVVDGITCDHPAVRAVTALLRRKPNHEAWPRIVGVLGEEWDQDKLVITYREWVSRGFNPFNLSGWLFRWYPEGIPEAGERSAANVYGSRDPAPKPRINQTEFCGRNGCRRGWIKSAGGLAACSCNLQERRTAP